MSCLRFGFMTQTLIIYLNYILCFPRKEVGKWRHYHTTKQSSKFFLLENFYYKNKIIIFSHKNYSFFLWNFWKEFFLSFRHKPTLQVVQPHLVLCCSARKLHKAHLELECIGIWAAWSHLFSKGTFGLNWLTGISPLGVPLRGVTVAAPTRPVTINNRKSFRFKQYGADLQVILSNLWPLLNPNLFLIYHQFSPYRFETDLCNHFLKRGPKLCIRVLRVCLAYIAAKKTDSWKVSFIYRYVFCRFVVFNKIFEQNIQKWSYFVQFVETRFAMFRL